MDRLDRPREDLQPTDILLDFIEDMTLDQGTNDGGGFARLLDKQAALYQRILPSQTEIGLKHPQLLGRTCERLTGGLQIELAQYDIGCGTHRVIVVDDTCGQGGRQDLAKGTHIVGCDPLPQRKLVGCDKRSVIQ